MKGDGFWKQLNDNKCYEDFEDNVLAMSVPAFGDSATKIGDPFRMLKMLDNSFASSITSNRISPLTSMYNKRSKNERDDIYTYVDDFETLFAQLERIGDQTAV